MSQYQKEAEKAEIHRYLKLGDVVECFRESNVCQDPAGGWWYTAVVKSFVYDYFDRLVSVKVAFIDPVAVRIAYPEVSYDINTIVNMRKYDAGPSIRLNFKCPLCGKSAYAGFNMVECYNNSCRNYVKQAPGDYRYFLPKDLVF